MIKKKKTYYKRVLVERWLQKYGSYLLKSKIEKELGFTKEAISRHLRTGRKLTNKEIIKLDMFIQEMFFSYEEDEKD